MLKEEVKKVCLTNENLFFDLCKQTKKNAGACMQFLYRNSSYELRSYEVLEIIKKHTGLTELEILEPLNNIDSELLESDVHPSKN